MGKNVFDMYLSLCIIAFKCYIHLQAGPFLVNKARNDTVLNQ